MIIPKSSWVVAAGMLGCVACGGGSGDGGSGREDATVRLAAGYRVEDVDGERRGRTLVLRNEGPGWEPVDENMFGESDVSELRFASPDVAWAWSSFSVYRSTDAGRTWHDVKANFPAEIREGIYVLRTFAFADATTGWFAAFSIPNIGEEPQGPFVWSTHDGGESWQPVASATGSVLEAAFVLGTRAGVPEILRHPPTHDPRAVVQRLDRPNDADVVTSVPTDIGRSFDSVGTRAWVPVLEFRGDDHAHPAIYTSERPGAPWIAQAVPDVPTSFFPSLDMCDRDAGLAGGNSSDLNDLPLVFWTRDGGAHWERSELGLPMGSSFSDALCVRSDEMWLAVYTGAPTLVRSADGGRTFDHVEQFSDAGAIFALATNAALQ